MSDLSFEDSVDSADIAISQSNSDVNREIEVVATATKRRKLDWQTEKIFENFDDALKFVEESGFKNYKFEDLKCGQKYHYRCKLIPKHLKPWCDRLLMIFLPADSSEVIVKHNSCKHTHDELLAVKKRKISVEMIEFLNGLFEKETTNVSSVIKHIDDARIKQKLFIDESNPTRHQIEYQLRKYRDSKVKPMIKLGDLMKWCTDNDKFPSNEDEAFVLSHECSTLKENLSFRFTITTPALLKLFVGLKTICIDATYKLNWLGYPLTVLGTVDHTRKFHPLVYACTSHERAEDFAFILRSVKESMANHLKINFEPDTIVADGSDAIRNAFYQTFSTAKLDVMCYAHVIRNVSKRSFSNKNNKNLIIDDIGKMQLAPNRSTFEMMTELFLEKWQQVESNFVQYFESEWLGVHCNWFEGAANYTPSTNNALESHNAVIKRKVTLRRRLPLNQFLTTMKQMTAEISIQFSSSARILAAEPTIPNELIAEAALMERNNFAAFKAKTKKGEEPSYITYLVPSSKCIPENSTEKHFKAIVKRTWVSFDEFVEHGYQQFWFIKIHTEAWKTKSMCTCPSFFKKYICKHILALAMREKIVACPNEALPTLLAAVRKKPGRPKRTAKALIIE